MFDKITKGTIDGTKSAKDFTIKNGKNLLGEEHLKEFRNKWNMLKRNLKTTQKKK